MNLTKTYKFNYLINGGNNVIPPVKENILVPIINQKKLTENDINEIYNTQLINIDKSLYQQNENMVNSTYGEMTYEGIEKLIEEAEIKPNEKFIDLGSGNGKASMQVFMNTPVSEAIGVEFHIERFYNANRALKNLYKKFPELLNTDRLLTYQLQNIKDVYFLEMFNIIYMCSTCYPSELLDVVYEKIKDSKNIRCIITHKKYDNFSKILPKYKVVNLPCTWSKNLSWNFYMK